MLRRIWALTVKEFIHLKNDWWLPAFMLIGGLVELLVVGWATSRPITNLPVYIVDQDRSPASRMLIQKVEQLETFDIAALPESIGDIEQALVRHNWLIRVFCVEC